MRKLKLFQHFLLILTKSIAKNVYALENFINLIIELDVTGMLNIMF